MAWTQASIRMQKSRKPALCTFRALPSIHTHSEPRHVPLTPIHASAIPHRISGLFGAHAGPSCVCAIPHECVSKDEHLDHTGRNAPSPSLLLAVTPPLPSSCSRLPIISCKELQPRSKQAKHPQSPTRLPANARVVFSNRVSDSRGPKESPNQGASNNLGRTPLALDIARALYL
ncbi:hypothetical protein HETIRDRAFT_106233 [Heterobasidion irregulare TC 32-1]|uniref:Uncharacterized protein n=1 Tax=Heterobasidion irregulare (strain TC 32-1) TaxID=747525 RepID=W4JUU3_HETIT|nr:uncharacterized protein HETIRDRAFT_106233 [Heterobasidion irregulare TC 32-1]ETW76845.1 hypothetical protein HETIRDRAFT_106233 [Heterobasidion irregulare TC 32-1]